MNKKLEVMLQEYPQMVFERDTLGRQLTHFKGITAEEVIESMRTPRNDGERVRASTVSDETANIAITYQDHMNRINREWYESLEKEFAILDAEVTFFENALASLPEPIGGIMQDMLLRRIVWDALEVKYSVCRMTLSRYRKRALDKLSLLYDRYGF